MRDPNAITDAMLAIAALALWGAVAIRLFA